MDEAGSRFDAGALAAAAAALQGRGEEPYAVAMRRGSLELGFYAPRGVDSQEPHDQNEVYVVVAGRGTFVVGDRPNSFGPGDALFVAAGTPHRFEDFTDDLEVWVMFYGPAGGEQVGSSS